MPCAVVSVQRLSARARLDDSPESLAHARAQAAAGDESWEQWVTEYERGDALIVTLELTAELAGGGGDVSKTIDGLFVERDLHAPKVEQQVAELASDDFVAIADELIARGHDVDRYELGEMYVHVELDHEVRRRLSGDVGRDRLPS
jgi:hypothetical protein